jgi:patatin-like phospholipase/acyl hydrolase
LYNYEGEPLEALLKHALGDRLLGASTVRLCIPAFEGKHSEVLVFKTPHHRDYKFDRLEPMVKAALATAAAPTYFRPLEHNGYLPRRTPRAAGHAVPLRDHRPPP